MANDTTRALRAELEAALAVLGPQLRGLEDLMHVSISDSLREAVSRSLAQHSQRRDVITATLTALDGLEGDGYPATPLSEISPQFYTELVGEEDDINAAVSLFVPEGAQPATTVTVALGEPVVKSSAK